MLQPADITTQFQDIAACAMQFIKGSMQTLYVQTAVLFSPRKPFETHTPSDNLCPAAVAALVAYAVCSLCYIVEAGS